jgi:hypothetical protein
MNTNLLFEEIKRLHEIMGVSPKNVILESIGQPWFESLMKDIIESATRNMDGLSDDIMDEAAYDAVRPWISKEFNLSNASPQDINSYLKTINDELISGKSLSNIGGGVNWYSLLDDLVKRDDSFYTKLIDDMINSGEFKEVADLLASTSSANKILSNGPEKNPKLYNSLIDNLNNLKTAIDGSSMDDNLKKIIKDKMGLNRIPGKSSIPDIDEAFSQIAKKIKGENIKYDDLVNLYQKAVVYPKSFNFENITKRMNDIKALTKPTDAYFGMIPNIDAFVSKVANRFKLYERLYRAFKGQPNKSVYIISSWILALTMVCALQKTIKVAWQLGIKSGVNVDVYESMYGELTNIITDLGGCLAAPYGIVVDLLDYVESVQGLDIKDKDVQQKLKSMLNNDQDNSDYIKLANGLIKNSNATKEDFEKLGLPTAGLDFGGESQSGEETEEQILSKWKDFEITQGNKVGENGVKKKDGLYYASENSTVGYEYDKKTKTFK